MNRPTGNKIQYLFLIVLLFGSNLVIAQHNLRLKLNKAWDTALIDSINITGYINSPEKTELNYSFSNRVDQWFIDIPNIKGEVSYDITSRISAANVTTDYNYKATFVLKADTVINLGYDETAFLKADTIINMHGGFAAINVHLPDGYQNSSQKYSVLYYITSDLLPVSQVEEKIWLKQYLDSLPVSGRFKAILVEIRKFSTGSRDPFDTLYLDQFSEVMISEIKPFVEQNFRTLTGKDNNFISGNSFGANEAYHTILQHPLVFGRAGIFSPIFQSSQEMVLNTTGKLAGVANGMFFFYIGKAEDKENVTAMSKTMDKLGARSKSLMYVVYDPEGTHEEHYWKKWFPEFHRWANSNGLNYIIRNN